MHIRQCASGQTEIRGIKEIKTAGLLKDDAFGMLGLFFLAIIAANKETMRGTEIV